MSTINELEVIPSANKLITSLRDLGYDFSSAIADLIDNSIEAGSTEIHIEIEVKGTKSHVRIADNGCGMTLSELKEAMRYGSETEYFVEKSLGKFGLGMKTASLSQCRRFTVASRSVNDRQRVIHGYSWDLAHIEKTNKWEILEVNSATNRDFVIGSHLKKDNGTVILWQHLDRILEGVSDDNKADRILLKIHRELEEHLGMVFHRFLAGEVPNKKINIYLNEIKIEPWDPFSRNEQKTQVLNQTNINLEFSNSRGVISVQPYILPHKDYFSSINAFEHASGPRKWNQQQGFYIYRSNRLIQSGGWSRLRTSDEHTKLSRIALSFTPLLDDAFKINVAKMKVQIPRQIKDELNAIIKPAINLALATYNKSQKQTAAKTSTNPPHPIEKIKKNAESNWTLNELQLEMEEIATLEEKPIITSIFKRFRDKLTERE